MSDLLAALCLVAVLEGLVLFAAPAQWQGMVRSMLEIEPRRLRQGGAVMIAIGLLCLYAVRG